MKLERNNISMVVDQQDIRVQSINGDGQYKNLNETKSNQGEGDEDLHERDENSYYVIPTDPE
jgi:hypothetical protein